MNRRIAKWNRSRTSLQDTWNRLFLSNFLKTLPFNSTNYKKINTIKYLFKKQIGKNSIYGTLWLHNLNFL